MRAALGAGHSVRVLEDQMAGKGTSHRGNNFGFGCFVWFLCVVFCFCFVVVPMLSTVGLKTGSTLLEPTGPWT